MQDKKKLLSQLVFIHERLTQTGQYFISEFDIAKDAIKTITDMANTLGEEIRLAEEVNSEADKEASNEKEK